MKKIDNIRNYTEMITLIKRMIRMDNVTPAQNKMLHDMLAMYERHLADTKLS